MADNKVVSLARKLVTGSIAGIDTDPVFYSKLGVLPNPDPILRRMGWAEETYNAIIADPHVIGEVRSMRADLIGYKFRIKAGADDSASTKAFDLCSDWYKNTRPSPYLSWDDVRWNMFTAVLYGFKAHELCWQSDSGHWLPEKVVDRANRRLVYTPEKEMRLLTKQEPVNGEPFEPYKFVITRHMPTHENPYGVALLSSCFWPYTFKHGGFKFFYQFCERFGMPWPIGRYPVGSQPKEQDALLNALVDLAKSGAAAIPEGSAVELLTTNNSGELAQEALVHLCNREMSKALTSQTLATEMRNVGSNAAAKTHSDRQGNNSLADRNMVIASFNEILKWITLFNFGEDATAPVAEFYKVTRADDDRMSAIEKAVNMGANPSKRAVLDELQLPEAESDEDSLTPNTGKASNDFSNGIHGRSHLTFSQAITSDTDIAGQEANKAIENQWLDPVNQMLQSYEEQGKTLKEFMDDLPKVFEDLDDAALESINRQVFAYAFAQGMDEQ